MWFYDNMAGGIFKKHHEHCLMYPKHIVNNMLTFFRAHNEHVNFSLNIVSTAAELKIGNILCH
jgi:hypothetical protein